MTQRSKYQPLWMDVRKKKAQTIYQLENELAYLKTFAEPSEKHQNEMARKQAHVDRLRHDLIVTT